MSLDDNVLLSIDVSSDDYATAAVEDAPAAVPRGHQTDEDFEATKAAYRARLENGDVRCILDLIVPTCPDPYPINSSLSPCLRCTDPQRAREQPAQARRTRSKTEVGQEADPTSGPSDRGVVLYQTLREDGGGAALARGRVYGGC